MNAHTTLLIVSALDGERIALYAVGSADAYMPLNPETNNQGVAVNKAFTADEHMRLRLPMTAGAHALMATFVGKPAALSSTGPAVDAILLTGPFDARPATGTDTASRERVFVCYPATADADAEEPCARTILSRLGRLAYRGPLAEAERETLMGFYRDGRLKGGFETGIELALRFMLASPEFVFRAEAEPASIASDTAYPVSDLDLASRPTKAPLHARQMGQLTGAVAELLGRHSRPCRARLSCKLVSGVSSPTLR